MTPETKMNEQSENEDRCGYVTFICTLKANVV